MIAVTWSRSLILLVLALLVLLPGLAQAWWNDDWAFRKQITLDTSAAGADLSTSLTEFPVLIRLHTGNFAYFLDVAPEGADLRFIAGDDETPLKYYVERFDPINQIGLIWVQVPRLLAGSNSDSIWLYYGNPDVASGDDPAGSFDKDQALVFGFSEPAGAPRDLTAYGNHPDTWTAEREAASFIAAGARFGGGQQLSVPVTPSLRLVPDAGWTVSAWVKPEAEAGGEGAAGAPSVATAAPSEPAGEVGEVTAEDAGDAVAQGETAPETAEPPAAAAEASVPVEGAGAATPATAELMPVVATGAGESIIVALEDAGGTLVLGLYGNAPFARFTDAAGEVYFTDPTGVMYQAPDRALAPGQWHHLALTAGRDGLTLYADGKQVATLPAPLVELGGSLTIGALASGAGSFVGEIDQVEIAKVQRSPEWIAAASHTQGQDAALIALGEDEQRESGAGHTYFWTILQHVSTDGWVIIGLLAMMSAASWLIMLGKGFTLSRIHKDNRAFMQDFRRLGLAAATLEQDDEAEDEALADSPMLMALFGKHDHYQSSTLFRVYQAGMQDIHQRLGRAVGAQAAGLSPAALSSVRATVDAAAVRQTQRLNSLMVLLTIAISGGPFLGLLGTVVGVMITFAAIAATGDVNINTIAPGVSAALLTTVAGLAVAIPALFGYNYLITRIRDMLADMQVFADELIAKAGEYHGD